MLNCPLSKFYANSKQPKTKADEKGTKPSGRQKKQKLGTDKLMMRMSLGRNELGENA